MFRRRTQTCAPTTEEAEPPGLDVEARLDERLIQNAQQGDLPSFNSLVSRHQRSVYNVSLRMLRDTALAEDATQDTFIKAWTSIGTFRGGLVRPWLLRIATNRCYDILRSQGRRPAGSLDVELVETEPQWTSQTAIAEHPEGHASRRELSAFLERALGELPDDSAWQSFCPMSRATPTTRSPRSRRSRSARSSRGSSGPGPAFAS